MFFLNNVYNLCLVYCTGGRFRVAYKKNPTGHKWLPLHTYIILLRYRFRESYRRSNDNREFELMEVPQVFREGKS